MPTASWNPIHTARCSCFLVSSHYSDSSCGRDDERRIYYELTGTGRTALEAELKRYRGVVAVAKGRLAHGH